MTGDSILVNIKQVANMCNVSVTFIKDLKRLDMIPAPIKLGRIIRWRRADILNWISTGCPKQLDKSGTNQGLS